MPFSYAISGLSVLSDIALPSAIPAPSSAAPDVTIQQAVLPEATAEQFADSSEPGEDRFWLRIQSSGRFLMEGGKRILYQPLVEGDPGELVLQLIGTCFSIILQQRGRLVLHASAVSVGGRAMLFCGESGAGKSTLAAMLSDRGYPLLNDDVCSLTQDHDGRFLATPDGRMLKLWSSSLKQLDRPNRGAEIIGRSDKFYALPANSDRAARPLGGIYLLDEGPAGQPPALTLLGRARAIAALHENAYRLELVRAMGQEQLYFQAAAALCATVPVYQLRRAKDFQEADGVLDLLAAAWAQ